MRIAVIGAGIVGVTTAYELAHDGHQVTVFERRGSVAEETSFANAGVVAPGYVTPWAAPGMPAKVLRHLLSRHAPVRLAMPPGAGQWGWIWRWWRACRAPVHAANRARLHRLARYSHQRLGQLSQTLNLAHEQPQGWLVLLRTARDLAGTRGSLKLLLAAAAPTMNRLNLRRAPEVQGPAGAGCENTGVQHNDPPPKVVNPGPHHAPALPCPDLGDGRDAALAAAILRPTSAAQPGRLAPVRCRGQPPDRT